MRTTLTLLTFDAEGNISHERPCNTVEEAHAIVTDRYLDASFWDGLIDPKTPGWALRNITSIALVENGATLYTWIPKWETPAPVVSDERADLVRRIAIQFAVNLDADGIDLKEVDRVNATPDYLGSGCCDSHDQCDANMYMLPAFNKIMGRADDVCIDMEDQADVNLWNEAWGFAKAQGFAKLATMGANELEVPARDFEASTQTLNPHVVDASRPHDEMIMEVIRAIADAIEGSTAHVATLPAVYRVFQSEDVLFTLRQELPNCEWFECYENLYNRGLLVRLA